MGEALHLRNIRQLTLDGDHNAEPAPLPDGTHVLFQSRRGGRAVTQVFVMGADGRNTRRVSPDPALAVSPAASPSGDSIVFSSAHADAQGIPLPAGAVAGADLLDLYESFVDGSQPHALAPAPGYDGEAAYRPDNGAVVFVSTRTGQRVLHTWERASGAVRAWPGPAGEPGSPAFSPDGARVVYALRTAPRLSELWLLDTTTLEHRPLTMLGVLADTPVFMPGGDAVLFSADARANQVAPSTNTDLYLLSLGSMRLERVTTAEGHDTMPRMSADGRTLYWVSTRQGGVAQVFAADWEP